ncbi:L559a mutant of Melanocarpus Albomyces laccase [Nemania sp. NC0429]|nr:L559a mutant of Melanocarpus Albomyces laccase [Nemania sp. NC0429]
MTRLLHLGGVVAGFLAGLGQGAPSLTHSHSLGPEPEPRGANCNTAHNRGCWSAGFDIKTDYESSTPPGVTRSFSFTIEEFGNWAAPDGSVKTGAMLINGAYPGPTIVADWGDTISVTVTNKLALNGTSIHWHGLRQLGSNLQDGVGGITECPIPPGGSKTYTFRVTQYGTTWYHSHFSSQYANGVFGAIQINGPSSANYDIDLGPYPINDFYLASAEDIVEASQLGASGPTSANVLFNGTNINPSAGGGGAYSTINLTPGKVHLLRLYNPSAQHHYQVSIVGHNLTVIETDLVPVEPIVTDDLFLAIGQRAHVLITADRAPGNYWMNVTLPAANKCGVSDNPFPAAIVHYTSVVEGLPAEEGAVPANPGCIDSLLYAPVVSRAADPATFAHTADNTVDVISVSTPTVHWLINGSSIRDSSMKVDWGRPVLGSVLSGTGNNASSYPASENLIAINQADAWTYWIIESTSTGPHPMHLHGHDFLILGTSAPNAGPFTPADVASLNFANPTRRDVTMLPPAGWNVLAFRSDNPGAWLFHCHIAWHASNGLALDFLERASEQKGQISPAQRSAYEDNCAAWNRYFDGQTLVSQTDSGLKVRALELEGH